MRVTRLGKDGPLGHEVGTVAALAERHTDFDSVRPMVEAEVMAWTTAEEYVAGAKAVAFVQAADGGRGCGRRISRKGRRYMGLHGFAAGVRKTLQLYPAGTY